MPFSFLGVPKFATALLITLLIGFSGLCHAQEQTTLALETLDSLRNRLEILFQKDQTFRRIYTQAEEVLGAESFEMEYFWEIVEGQDRVLEAELSEILEKYGWLGISQVGRRANTAQWAIVQHSKHEFKQKYAPLMKASVLAGESQALQYARLIDWMKINNNEKQIYGTATRRDEEGNLVFHELEDREKVNMYRKEIGLVTIEEYAESLNIEWD